MRDPLFDTPHVLSFPPLVSPHQIDAKSDPFAKARAMAALGCDSGSLVHCVSADRLRAAIVFAPEVPLEQACQVFCACATGFQNAFGALAPPEVALHLTWDGNILVNGAKAGAMQIAASHSDPKTTPDWLVVGFDIWLLPQDDVDPGKAPELTSLFMEGCADVSPQELLEGWARHTLVWVNTWDEGDIEVLHREWRELLYGIGTKIDLTVADQHLSGTFLGADAGFSMILRVSDDTTKLIPVSALLGDMT